WLFLATTAGVRMFDLTAPPQLSINDVTVNDGNGLETTNAQFTVTLSRIEQLPVTVNYATADGTATAVQDYAATSGTLLFSPTASTLPDTNGTPLAMTQTVTVPVVNGGANESETFAVNLGNASNAQVVRGQGIGTIQNTVVY